MREGGMLTLKKVSWDLLEERRRGDLSKVATDSHASLPIINCKQRGDESAISFIYKWKGLLLQNCGILAERFRD